MSHYLFVYGSLKHGGIGEDAARMAKQLSYVDQARVAGRLYDFGPYAGAILDDAAESVVIGEVLEVPNSSVLRELDRYEEYDPTEPQSGLFVRRQVRALLESGQTVTAWIYVYNREPGDSPLIANGEYSKNKG